MEKKKSTRQSKGKLYRIAIILVLLAFIIFMLTDLFTKRPRYSNVKNNYEQTEVYSFTKQGELSFQSAEGKYISSMDIELADNDHERSQGLMYRTEMKENQGMLFVFPYEARQSFYMKNTVISLDMLFINADLKIVTILQNTVPYSLESLPSTAPAQYVLETVAGYTAKYNIHVGDKVIFRKTN